MANTKKYVSLDKLGLYDGKIKKYLDDADKVVLQSAKDYADDAFETANSNAESLANTAEQNAKTYTDGQISTVNGTIANVKAIAEQGVADAATADDKAVAAQSTADGAVAAVEDLADYVGEIPADYTEETVIGYINKKAEETLAAAQGGSSETAASVKAQLDTYKTENNAKVNKNAEDITALQTALEGETARADAAEKANTAAIKAISDDYLKAADKTELQGNINTVSAAVERLTNGVSADEVDGVNDLIQYVKDHGTEVTGMQGDIADNTAAIEGVANRMTTAEGKITNLEGAVATKVEQSAYDQKIAALEGVDSGLDTRLQAVEAKFGDGEGNVEAQIEAAKTAAISAAAADAASKDAALKTEIETAYKKYADEEDAKIESRVDALETASATHALASDLTTLAGRITTAEGEIDTLQSEMDAVEAKALANEGAIGTINTELAKKAADADLTAAKDRITALETWHSNFIEVSEEEINNLFA